MMGTTKRQAALKRLIGICMTHYWPIPLRYESSHGVLETRLVQGHDLLFRTRICPWMMPDPSTDLNPMPNAGGEAVGKAECGSYSGNICCLARREWITALRPEMVGQTTCHPLFGHLTCEPLGALNPFGCFHAALADPKTASSSGLINSIAMILSGICSASAPLSLKRPRTPYAGRSWLQPVASQYAPRPFLPAHLMPLGKLKCQN